jgi:peptide deformylase
LRENKGFVMAVRPIVLYPDPVLLEPARPVTSLDEGIRDLVRDMVDTMYAAPGVGLAANQIGVPLRVFVMDASAGERPEQLQVLINPIVKATDGTQVGEEGCLSFPGVTLDIERPFKVTIEAIDLDGRVIAVTGEGLAARAMLHEIEHLDGETFLRNVSPLRRELTKRQIQKRIKTGDWAAAAAE